MASITRASWTTLCLVTFCFQSGNSLRAAQQEIRGKITEVTVYRDQARVVRQLTLSPSPELQQIRVSGLPARIAPATAFTESAPGTTVRSMRVVSARSTVDPETLDRLEQLRAKKGELLKKLRSVEHHAKAIEQDLLTVERLVDFSAVKVKENLDRATLDVQSVTALADFSMTRRRQLAEEFLQTEEDIAQLKKDIEENDTQQGKLITGNAKLTYEALMSVVSPGGGVVRLVYDVGGVQWSPRYSVRSKQTDDGKRGFSLQLDAHLIQDSGEPWEDVAITLSTSTPQSQAARPLLTPLRVYAVAAGQQSPAQGIAANLTAASQPGWVDPEMMQRNARLNSAANHRQVTELTSAAEVQRAIAEDAGKDVADENYVLDKSMKIANHPQVQTVSILSEQLTGDLHHVITPLLSSFAFREAELFNTSGRNLIAGGMDVYLDGEFVGRTTMPPTAAGQRLTIGFGTDRQLRTRRELLSRDETVQGGNRRSILKHRLVVSNYHETPIAIRLLDRIPIAAKDGSISVSIDQATTDTLSKDGLYQRMQRPTGVLRWDLEVPARRFGSEAFDHEYSYSIELDRQQTIVSNMQKTLSDLRFQKMNMGGGMGGGGSF